MADESHKPDAGARTTVPARELKIRAELLHKCALGEPGPARERAWKALRRVPEFRKVRVDAAATEDAPRLQHKHCLAAIALELGFTNYAHALLVLEGELPPDGVGALLSPRRCAGFLNTWFSDLAEARRCREDGSFLLGFKKHFMVVGADYVRALGLDPEDPAWARIDRDWMHADGAEARRHFYACVFAADAEERSSAGNAARSKRVSASTTPSSEGT